jgi:hypothetical protein
MAIIKKNIRITSGEISEHCARRVASARSNMVIA